MSLSVFELKRKKELGNTEAQLVYPLRKKGNELLVTLIVGNVLVNSALTVSLDSRFSGVLAVVFSTILITLFGEIIPQAMLKKHALSFGARLAPYLSKVMLLMTPIAKPLAILLDRTIGDEIPAIYSKQELVKILEEHERSDDSEIEADELRIVENALKFGDITIEEVMTPKSVIGAVKVSDVIGPVLLDKLHKTGFSRFPVYEGSLDNIVGVLYMQDLVKQSKKQKSVSDVMTQKVYFVNENQKLDHALNAFLRTKHHMFIVVNEFQETVGIITIEDIIEQIIGHEIVDEFDNYDDMREVAAIQAKKRADKINAAKTGQATVTAAQTTAPSVKRKRRIKTGSV